jgi:hypothetical protein
MRVLVRHCSEPQYMMANGSWTSLIDEAHDFQHISIAVDRAIAFGLRDVEIVLKFKDRKYDIALNLVRSGS